MTKTKMTGIYKSGVSVLGLLLAVVLLAGCEAPKFSFTRVGDKTTIEVNNAADGDEAESGYFTVGNGEKVVITSALEQGELKIDIATAIVYFDPDGADEIYAGDVVTGLTVDAGDTEELFLEKGDYLLEVTAIGSTSGEVTVNVEKE